MFEPQAGRRTDPARFLSGRRPVRLRAVGKIVLEHERWVKALRLIRTYFPDYQPGSLVDYTWLDLMRLFLRQVEQAGWFPIAWHLIQDFETLVYYDYPERVRGYWRLDAWNHLARIVEYIPLRWVGFQSQWNHTARELQVLEYLQFVFQPGTDVISSGGKVNSFTYPFARQWNDVDRRAARSRLETCPPCQEPLCWLPEVVRYVTSDTGNVLIDRGSGVEDWFRMRFRWSESDIAECRSLWQEASQIVEHVKRLVEWLLEEPAVRTQEILNIAAWSQTFD